MYCRLIIITKYTEIGVFIYPVEIDNELVSLYICMLSVLFSKSVDFLKWAKENRRFVYTFILKLCIDLETELRL